MDSLASNDLHKDNNIQQMGYCTWGENGLTKKEKKVQKKRNKQIEIQYRFIKELAQQKYDDEIRREQNLIQQSSQMQTAFSFMTAAVFMAIPICIEYKGYLPLLFFYIGTSIIIGWLIVSLICASLAQWRWKTDTLDNIEEVKNSIIGSEEWKKYLTEYHRLGSWIDMMSKIQKSKNRINNLRVKLIIASMTCFYGALLSIVILFIIATIITY